MAGVENLRPVRSKEEAREKGRKGGIASGEARRRKKTMQEMAKLISQNACSDKKLKKNMAALGVDDEDQTNGTAITAALWSKALSGDVRAIELWLELSSEESDNKIDALKELLSGIGSIK